MKPDKFKIRVEELIGRAMAPPTGDVVRLMGRIRLDRAGSEAINELVDCLLAHRWEAAFSEKFVQDHVGRAMQKSLSGANAEVVSGDLIKGLSSFDEWQEVFFPILGLQLNDRESLQIGRVDFINSSETNVDSLLDRANAVIDRTTNSQEEKALFKAQAAEVVRSALGHPVFCRYSVLADPTRAVELAEMECMRSLNFLRFAAPFVRGSHYYIGLGLPGEVPFANRTHLTFSSAGSFKQHHGWSGRFRSLALGTKQLSHLEELGILRAAEMLRADSLSDFEQRLLASIEWFGRSMSLLEYDFQLLCLITSLESLLSPSDDRGVRHAVSEGVAVVLGNDLDERRTVESEIADLYQKRSRITHGGNQRISISDVINLTSLTAQFLLWALGKRDEFRSRKELRNWIRDQLLTPGQSDLGEQ